MTKRKPAYLLHKPTGQARVRINGKDHYLGKYGTPESRDRYDELVTNWLRQTETAKFQLTIDDLVLLYLDHARAYYVKDGLLTSEFSDIRSAVRPLINLFGTTRARDFGPQKLKQVREAMVDLGWCRTTVNAQNHRLRRMYRWAVENELVPADVLTALLAVAALKQGRTQAPESKPVEPVPDEVVIATLPHLSPVVADMVRVQRLSGMRPTEVCLLRPCDIDRSASPWTYRPSSHKTEHRGRSRMVFLGPKVQEILLPYLDRKPEMFCFAPAEAEAQRRAAVHAARRTPLHQGNRPGSNRRSTPRTHRNRFVKDSYCRAIARACERAFGMPPELRKIPRSLEGPERASRQAQARAWRELHCWSPNQLRHSFATQVRREHGLEAAQVLLGHSEADTTQIYAERDAKKAAEVAHAIG